MSDPERPDSAGRAAFLELENVIRNVTDQLAGFRRRALSAESQVRDLERALGEAEQATAKAVAEARQSVAPAPISGERSEADKALIAENAALRARLDEAGERTRQISERVRFLRQQIGNGGEK